MRRVVEVESRLVTVAPDDVVDDHDRWQALVRGRAVDELSGQPVDVECSPTARWECQSGPGGVFGIAGRRRDVALGLEWAILLSAEGFTPTTINGLFTGGLIELGDVELRRAPVSLAGSTVFSPGNAPLDNVTVTLDGIKRRESDPQTPPDIVAVDLPLAVRRTMPTTVTAVTPTDRPLAAGESPLRLAAVIEPGATEINLVDVAAIASGQTLRLGDLDREYVEVAGIDSVRPRVKLATPVMRRRWVSSPVAEQTVAVGSGTPLLGDSEAGDTVLFVSHAAIATRQAVRMSTAGVPDEIRVAIPYQTTTLADGQWAFPPISRVTEIAVKVTRPSYTLLPPVAVNLPLRINYAGRAQRRDFVLKKTP